jgi:hypothetical protein
MLNLRERYENMDWIGFIVIFYLSMGLEWKYLLAYRTSSE